MAGNCEKWLWQLHKAQGEIFECLLNSKIFGFKWNKTEKSVNSQIREAGGRKDLAFCLEQVKKISEKRFKRLWGCVLSTRSNIICVKNIYLWRKGGKELRYFCYWFHCVYNKWSQHYSTYNLPTAAVEALSGWPQKHSVINAPESFFLSLDRFLSGCCDLDTL